MDGMQLGIKITGPTHAFEARQRVNWDCYLRNTTDHDLGLAFGGHWYMEELPEVYRDAPGAAGTKLQVQGAFFTGLDPEFCLVLKPGEAVSVYAIGLGLGKDQGLAGGENKPHEGNLPYLIEPAIGAYLLKQTVLAHTMATSEVARINGPTNDRIFNDRNDLTVLGADGKTTTKIAARMIPLDIQCKPLTSGAERFTIAAHAQPKAAAGSASDSANPTVGADNVSWGKAVSGLQAGLRSPDGRTAWGYGDTVEMDYIVRNISRHPIEFEHDVTPGVAGVISNILDAQGRPASTFGLPVIHTAAMVHVALDPGSSIVVGQTRMGVLPRGGSSRQLASPTSNWVEAGPGDYTIRHLDTLYIMGAGSGNLTLYTGYLKLHIQPAALEGSGPSLKTTDVQPQAAAGEPAVSSAAAGRETISWGKSIGGLRAGLALHENSIRIGKDLRADLYINNTSNHEIKIDYISNDDKFIVPDLWNSKRQKLKYDWRDMTVEQKIAGHAVLKPGESACVAHPGLNVSPWGNDEEAQLNVGTMFTHFVAQPGVFHVRFTAALMGPNTTWMYYPTAEVKFTLTGFGG